MQITFDPTNEADRNLVQQIVKTLPLTGSAPKQTKTSKTTSASTAKAKDKPPTVKTPTVDEVGNALGKFVEKHGREAVLTVLQTFGVDSPKKLDKAFWGPLLVSLAAYEPEDGAVEEPAADPLGDWG